MTSDAILQILPGATAIIALLLGGLNPLFQRALDHKSVRGKLQQHLANQILGLWEQGGSIENLRRERDLWLALLWARRLRSARARKLVVDFVAKARDRSIPDENLMESWALVVDTLSETARA